MNVTGGKNVSEYFHLPVIKVAFEGLPGRFATYNLLSEKTKIKVTSRTHNHTIAQVARACNRKKSHLLLRRAEEEGGRLLRNGRFRKCSDDDRDN